MAAVTICSDFGAQDNEVCHCLHCHWMDGLLSLCLFNLYAEYIMRNAGLDEAQAVIKIAGRNINMQTTPHLWQKVKN